MGRRLATRFLAGLAGVLLAASAGAICARPGVPAQDLAFESADGDRVSLSEYRGRVVVLAFWASWCDRCLEELAFLGELAGRLADDAVVLAVNQESEDPSPEALAQARRAAEARGVPFPLLLDRSLEAWGALCMNALPTSVIVDRQGTIRFAEPNFYWASRDKIETVLRELDALRPNPG